MMRCRYCEIYVLYSEVTYDGIQMYWDSIKLHSRFGEVRSYELYDGNVRSTCGEGRIW